MFEFGLTEDILNGRAPVKLAHGIRISRLANENFYMMLPTLDGSSLGCCDDVGACDCQNLAANVVDLWPTSRRIPVRPCQLHKYYTQGIVDTLKPHFARVYRWDSTSAIPSNVSELSAVVRAMVRQNKIIMPSPSNENGSDALVTSTSSNEIASRAPTVAPRLLQSPSSVADVSHTSECETNKATRESKRRRVTVIQGEAIATTTSMLRDGGQWAFLSGDEAHVLGGVPAWENAVQEKKASSFTDERMKEKVARSLVSSIEPHLSQEIFMSALGHQFGLGYENGILKRKLSQLESSSRKKEAEAYKKGIEDGASSAAKAIEDNFSKFSVVGRMGNGMSANQWDMLRYSLSYETNQKRDARPEKKRREPRQFILNNSGAIIGAVNGALGNASKLDAGNINDLKAGFWSDIAKLFDNKPDPNFSSEIKSHYCKVNGIVLTPQKNRKQRSIEVKVSNFTATIPMPALTPNRNVMREVQQKRAGTPPNTDASSHAWTYDELSALKSVPTHITDDAPLLRQVATTAEGPACTVDDWERLVDIKFKAPGESEEKSMVDRHPNWRSKRIFASMCCRAHGSINEGDGLGVGPRATAAFASPPTDDEAGLWGVEETAYVGNEINISLPSGDVRRVRVLDQRALLLQQLTMYQRDGDLARPGDPNEAKELSLVRWKDATSINKVGCFLKAIRFIDVGGVFLPKFRNEPLTTAIALMAETKESYDIFFAIDRLMLDRLTGNAA